MEKLVRIKKFVGEIIRVEKIEGNFDEFKKTT